MNVTQATAEIASYTQSLNLFKNECFQAFGQRIITFQEMNKRVVRAEKEFADAVAIVLAKIERESPLAPVSEGPPIIQMVAELDASPGKHVAKQVGRHILTVEQVSLEFYQETGEYIRTFRILDDYEGDDDEHVLYVGLIEGVIHYLTEVEHTSLSNWQR